MWNRARRRRTRRWWRLRRRRPRHITLLPFQAATQIGTLEFNDEVVLLDTASGWARVDDVRRHRTGWASLRYLQPMPANQPQNVPRRRPATAPQEPPKPAESPKAM